MAKTLPISEVKARLPELVTGVSEREDEVVVTRNGRPAAVLVNYAEYARLKETLDVLCDRELMEQVRESRSFHRKRRKGPFARWLGIRTSAIRCGESWRACGSTG